MSRFYAHRDRDRDLDRDDASDYVASLYQQAPRPPLSSTGAPFSPPASPTYEFTPRQQQRMWPGRPHGVGSYEERERAIGGGGAGGGGGGGGGFGSSRGAIPIRVRERTHSGDYDMHGSASPRTPTFSDPRGLGAGSTVGGGGGGGSAGRRERTLLGQSPRYESWSSAQQRRRGNGHDDDDDDDDDDNDEDDDEGQRPSRETEHERDRASCRQRMRYATQGYAKRLRSYLEPVLHSPPAMDHAVEIFAKLEKDSRYLSRSAGVLLETLAAVADDVASSTEGGNGTGLDDPATDSEFTGESSSSALEDDDSDDDDDDRARNAADSTDSDDNVWPGSGAYGDGDVAGTIPNFSRRPSAVRRDSDNMGVGGRRRSSNVTATGNESGGRGDDAAAYLRKKGGATSAPFMHWGGFQPYALSKEPDALNDRRKSYLALVQIVGVNMPSAVGGGDDDDGASGSAKSRSKASAGRKQTASRLSPTKGLLVELLRVLQPRDYRAYFRAATARVILLPDTGTLRHPEERVLESLERQLLLATSGLVGTASSSSTPPPPMMACLTYTSTSNYGSVTLYRLEMAPAREGGGSDWPRRLHPVCSMTAVPKELLRRTARSMAPSRRTVLKMQSTRGGGDGGGKNNQSKDGTNTKTARLRWVSLPADTTAVPGLGYSPNVGRAALSPGLCEALAIEADDLKIAAGTSANMVNATVPAMLAWLHVRAAYLTGVELEGTEIQRGSSSSKDTGSGRSNESSFSRDKGRNRDRDDASTSAAVPQRARIRRIVRWKRGPAPVEHEGRDPCIVVLHPSRGEWVTAPVYWTEAKD
ncbi:hypothetical protein SPI_02582 [Niveomyces insectorum RCEF 264]|uniref:Uncharacterized protein n=1 Tax=Niveomyces insectorum RCEF 264 TaxID=1081102 RepID=A0A167Y3Q4_9HYPO|nr:hypothetical protein SPI_02582 [Niveomyces insectorum RCEF 264]